MLQEKSRGRSSKKVCQAVKSKDLRAILSTSEYIRTYVNAIEKINANKYARSCEFEVPSVELDQ